jgi:hypothetical protein
MSDPEKKELMDIVDRLPPTKVVQLLEFAKHLQTPGKASSGSVAGAIQRTRGKYKDVLSSSEEFASRKSDERFLESR